MARLGPPVLGSRAFFALVLLAACGSHRGDDASSAANPVDEARRLVDRSAILPTRVEAVALADQVAVAGTREGGTTGAEILGVAAALRERVHRIDHQEGDLREAILLREQARELATGTEAGCIADGWAARLKGELARSPVATYREVYLAKRRQRARLPDPSGPCLDELERVLALLASSGPTGPARAVLEKEGDRAATAAAPPPTGSAPVASTTSGIEPAVSADVVVSPTGVPTPTGPVKITKIERFGGEGGGRVVIHLSAPTTFSAGALAAEAGKSPRVYVDVDVASSKGVARETDVGGAIERVRLGARDGGGTRVVLDLAKDLHKRVFYLPEPFRIVVDISSRAPQAAAAATASGPRPVTRVAIDPGHGGDDGGAIGPTGLKEKDVTLDIAHRVAPVLAHELKIETMLTRDTDVFVPLDERAARANAFHADLFISIHCNASENGEARGLEVFVLDELKDVSRAASRVAAVENGFRTTALDDGRLDAEMARIFSGLRSGETAARSRKMGDLLLRASQSSLSGRYGDTKDHGIKSAAFFVLAGAEMPAVLFETSFISNPADEQRLATADYRQKLADGVVNAIRAYREGK